LPAFIGQDAPAQENECEKHGPEAGDQQILHIISVRAQFIPPFMLSG
jgi:hypothetical protein